MLTFSHLIPDNSVRILDMGCKAFDMLSNFKQHRSKEPVEIIGVDSLDSQHKNMLDVYIRKLELDFDNMTELSLPQEYFDCILCLDILQKMVNPDNFLSIFIKPHLLPGGTLILSVPNILHNSFLLNLLCKGRFKGSLVTDNSHDLRFFSIFEIVELLARNGFEVDNKIYCTVSPENPQMSEFYNDLNTLILMNNNNNYELLGRVVCFVLKCRKADPLESLQPILWNNYTFFTAPYNPEEKACVIS